MAAAESHAFTNFSSRSVRELPASDVGCCFTDKSLGETCSCELFIDMSMGPRALSDSRKRSRGGGRLLGIGGMWGGSIFRTG